MIYTESPVTQTNWSEAPMTTLVFALFGIAAFSGISAAQAPSKVDFAKDVQPMLPAGPLKPEQIAIIKAWIDQGADWPDSLANEAELAPLEPKAVAMVES